MTTQLIGHVAAKLIGAAALCKAANDVTACLNGIHIEPHPAGGVVVVSTNRHILFAGYDPDGAVNYAATLNLPKTFTKECAKVCQFENSTRQVELDGETAHVISRKSDSKLPPGSLSSLQRHRLHAACPIKTIDGDFPDYDNIIPDTTLALSEPTGFSTEYLSRLPRIAAALQIPKPARFVTAFGTGDEPKNSPASVTIYRFNHHSSDALVAIMPARHHFEGNGIPRWVSNKSGKQATAK